MDGRSRWGVAVVRVPLAVLGGVVSGVVALLAGGCDPTPKPAPPIKVSPSASVDPKAKVEADYLAYWSALKAAHEASNPSYPDLRKHATGDQLQKAMQAIESLRSGGLQLRGDVTHESKVVSLTGSVANIDDCIDTSGRTLFDRKSGKPHTPQPSGRKLHSIYVLTETGGSWLVSQIQSKGECG